MIGERSELDFLLWPEMETKQVFECNGMLIRNKWP